MLTVPPVMPGTCTETRARPGLQEGRRADPACALILLNRGGHGAGYGGPMGHRAGQVAPDKDIAMNQKMTAGDLCNRIVTVVEPGLSVVAAARLMREHHVGCLVVTVGPRETRKVVGMLTDRDIVTAIVAKEVDPSRLIVEDVMTANVVTAGEDDTVMDLLEMMRSKGIRRLPVTTPEGMLVGLMALDDLLEVVAEQLLAVVKAIGAEQARERKVRT